MNEDVFRRKECRLCGSEDRELVFPLAPTPVGEGYVPAHHLGEKQESYPMDLYLCRACGHAEFPDVINPEILYRNYLYQTSIENLGIDDVRKLSVPASAAQVQVH